MYLLSEVVVENASPSTALIRDKVRTSFKVMPKYTTKIFQNAQITM
jgi:hypothetical protein